MFSILFIDFLELKCHTSGLKLKLAKKKLFIIIFFSSNPIKCPILQSAFSCPALLLHNLDIYSSKFNLLSTSRPNNVTFSEEVITFSFIVSFWGILFFGSSSQLLLSETLLLSESGLAIWSYL